MASSAVPVLDNPATLFQSSMTLIEQLMRLHRLYVLLHAEDQRDHRPGLVVGESEIGHLELFLGCLYLPRVEDAGVLHFLKEPCGARMRDLGESEIQPGDHFGPFVAQFHADWQRLLEPGDIVAAETTVPRDKLFP